MVGKEILKQYNSLLEEIKNLERKIDRLEKSEPQHEIDSVRGSNPYFPYEAKNFTIEGYNIIDEEKKDCKLEKMLNILYSRNIKCKDMKIQIEEFISNIPDSLTRRVFQYRYVDNLEWLPIARKIGRHEESYPRKVIHDKYLEGLE